VPATLDAKTMNITEELQKLADLRAQGHLTDQEFASAKSKLLAGDRPQTAGLPERTRLNIDERTYQSSRWSSGNFFYPDALRLTNDGIIFRKGRMLGSTEENINYRAVASVRIRNGLIFSAMLIETSGGSQPIFINGLRRADAKLIHETIRRAQQQA